EFNLIKNDLQDSIKDMGRILIRPSGTENKIRILLESRDKNIIDAWVKKLDIFIENYKNSSQL
ncbi:MAG: hypothetical protein ACOC56_01225, partial [Atribacterota bacterium]